MKNPLISVLIASYNSEKTIEKTLCSIIKQSYQNFEIIIVDNCSSDSSPDIIKSYAKKDKRIRCYFQHENKGIRVSRNLLIQYSNGEYFAFIDSDDLWEEDKLKNQLEFMIKNNVLFSYTDYILFSSKNINKNFTYHTPSYMNIKRLLKRNDIGLSTIMINADKLGKEIVEEDYLEKREDMIIWEKYLTKCNKAYNVGKPMTWYRISPGSATHKKFSLIKLQYDVYRKYKKMNKIMSFLYVFRWCVVSLPKLIRIKIHRL